MRELLTLSRAPRLLLVFPIAVSVFSVALALLSNAAVEAPSARLENEAGEEGILELVVAGQALIKVDPRRTWDDPFGTVRSIVQSADVGFTNFEMAVNASGNGCNIPEDYVTVLGAPRIQQDERPGNASRPHAVESSVMEFLASMNFNLMSLANNHTWDLGECGVQATIAAADRYGVTHAGAGSSADEAVAPAFLEVGGTKIALVAATTSHDERHLLMGEVNGVWTGHGDDWDRNIAAVREAAEKADFVIYYQHFQIDLDEFEGMDEGEATEDGHRKIDDVAQWQGDFAKAIIDAGASIYIGHGHRGFDGVEIYKGRPIFRQFGGLAYQGLRPEIGAYEGHFAWWGLLGILTVRDGYVKSIEFVPLDIDEGEEYVADYDAVDFLTRRGFAEVASGTLATDILTRFQELSAHYGASVEIRGERAFVAINEVR